ncbi:shikimate kinase [Microbacterium sp. zg.B48]|uniref:shikimate kinase n=1 Tax=unclassified Microbacterium TaxID=2609290 RepID=UPI00214B37ED|nr:MULTISPECIES: shikimate kinase [unclassified Microbacterium]MCR2762000.1 shikimate kinase [Microbacterium sp. zg.B48]MCR2811041.1 shikimate kinase [Microbacterium sp. zg.B185]WIM17705.1 shikimate kinase [Microbacterium sp. zg-B185]
MTSPDSAIVLIGPMGAGKTSVGRRVARALGQTFTDTDKAIVRDHGPIPELFDRFGEARFREIERTAVSEALAHGGVVALGGGAILDADTRADLSAHRVVLLTVSPHIVAARLHGSDRPLLADADPLARWQRIFAERRGLYEEVADVTFDTSSGPLAAVVAAIAAWAQNTQSAEEDA